MAISKRRAERAPPLIADVRRHRERIEHAVATLIVIVEMSAMKRRLFSLLLLASLSFPAVAQNNTDLAALFAADQAARRSNNIDWAVVNAQDAERRSAVMEILTAGGIRSAQDYYNAAMIFQHGDSEEDIRLAHSFATVSAALGSTSASKWLMAASWDRLMLRLKQPQWYGTQFVKGASGRWMLYEVLPGAVSDEQRAAWSVPSLADAKARAERMNGDR